MRWRIYYRDREHAADRGDPVLGLVEATTREEAEWQAERGLWLLRTAAPHRPEAGYLAVPAGRLGYFNVERERVRA